MNESNFYRPINWQRDFRLKLIEAIEFAGSKKKLANIIGVMTQTILSWERGAVPNDESINKLKKYIQESMTKKHRT